MAIIERLTGPAAAGLVHRPRQPEHAPPGGRPRRLRVRQRLLRRRPAVLAAGDAGPTARWRRTWSCRTRWTATTCASRCRRASAHGDEFFAYLRDAFDVLYAEGDERPSMMSIGMHCRLLGRPGRMRALQRFLDHVAAPRPRLGRAAHRHRAALAAQCIRSMPAPPSSGSEPRDPDPGPTQRRRAGRVRRAARRHLRALAVDRRARAAAAARSTAWRSSSSRWSRWCAAAGRDAQLALIRAHPELAGKAMVTQDADRRVDARAGQGRPDRLHAGGVRAHPAAQRRLQRQVRLPVHPRGARAARHRPGQGRDHRHLRAAAGQPPRLRARRVPAQHPPHRRDAPGRQVRPRARTRQPGLGLGRAPGARTATPATPSAAS